MCKHKKINFLFGFERKFMKNFTKEFCKENQKKKVCQTFYFKVGVFALPSL